MNKGHARGAGAKGEKKSIGQKGPCWGWRPLRGPLSFLSPFSKRNKERAPVAPEVRDCRFAAVALFF